MEPALDERGDEPADPPRRRPGGAAMEPALDERGDWAAQDCGLTVPRQPQWSPLSTSGATWSATDQDGRGQACRNGARSRRAGRRERVTLAPVRRGAAMEPALDERGDRARGPPPGVSLARRNGARSRRAGRRTLDLRRHVW